MALPNSPGMLAPPRGLPFTAPGATDDDGDTRPLAAELTEDEGRTLKVDMQAHIQGSSADVFKGTWYRPAGRSIEEVVVKVVRLTGMALEPAIGSKSADELAKIDRKLGREIFVWQRLQHSRITPLIGWMKSSQRIMSGHRPFLVTPYRRNGNLKEYLEHNPGVNRLALLKQAAEGLIHLHTHSPSPIAHLDVKPENILVDDKGEAELCDFGISKVLGETSGCTSTGGTTGSYPYMSAQVLDGEIGTTAADIYAFAGVILGTLSGKMPFHDWVVQNKKSKLILAISTGRLPSREEYDFSCLDSAGADMLWSRLEQCWSMEEKDRPSAMEVLDTLQRLEPHYSPLEDPGDPGSSSNQQTEIVR